MDLFIASCLMFFTNSLLLLFRFIALQVLRREDLKATLLDGVKEAQHKDRILDEREDRSFPRFSLLFHQQILKHKEIPVTAMAENQSPLASTDMHIFWPDKYITGYMEEPKTVDFQVQESFFRFEDFQRSDDAQILQFDKQIFEKDKFNYMCSERISVGEKDDNFIMEEFFNFNSDNESSSDGFSMSGFVFDSNYDNLKSEHDSNIGEISTNNQTKEVEDEVGNDDKRNESVNEELPFAENGRESLYNIKEADSKPKSETSHRDETEKSSNNDLSDSSYVSYEKQHTIDDNNDEKQLAELEKEEERSQETCCFDLDEEQDEMWEHQDLIEQLKMELRKIRAIGLPTILEESENSTEFEDHKPLKINNNQPHQNLMDELHKFYKCYEEKMRKFDSLNYQQMYATGFLHLNDPLELRKTLRPMFSTIIYHVSQNLLPFCIKKSRHDPSEMFVKKLRSDLETIYVGQTCLSWECLRWQFEKLHEFSNSDSFINHKYNNVVAEFQQFKVTLHRFVENEPFQGPRIANYTKQRCILRNFLQSPAIKEDSLMDEAEKRKDEDVITRDKLEEIMEEAMRVFWVFVIAETYETPKFLKGLVLENLVELQEPSDYEFMVDIRANLQKKEKKLKDLLKAGNCIVKKLKRRQEHRSNQELFFSKVDLKLVSRVLSMSRITSDQLIWCQKKLSKINFSGRKLHREPSILLFPS